MSKYKTHHVELYDDLRSEDYNNIIVMRIAYDNYPCRILIMGQSSTSYVPMT